MLVAVTPGGVTELPAMYALINQSFVIVTRGNPGCGEYPAVVVAASQWAMLIDRTPAIDQHRTVAILIVTQQYIALGQTGRRE
jgi:hypothetical protein